MKRPPLALLIALLITLLAGCAGSPTLQDFPAPLGLPDNQAPMFGGMAGTKDPQLAESNAYFVQEATAHYGDRQTAAARFIQNGFDLYRKNDSKQAMRRFNQAWLLDPNNPEIYWGFAVILKNLGYTCDAIPMLDMAIAHKAHAARAGDAPQTGPNRLDTQGFYPDAGRIINLCATQDHRLSPSQRRAMLEKADSLYREGELSGFDRVPLYESWARAYSFREDYANAWKMVEKLRAAGGQPDPRFLSVLRGRMPEPKAGP